MRVLRQVMHCQRAANALPQHHERLALYSRRCVQPVESRLNILIDRRQTGLALRLAVAAIVDHQDLITLLGQPPASPQMP